LIDVDLERRLKYFFGPMAHQAAKGQAGRIKVRSGPAGTAALILGLVGVLGTIMTMGYLAPWFMICSVAAWSMGEREVQKYKALGVPVADLGSARAGHILGIVGVVMGALIAVMLILVAALIAVAISAKSGLEIRLLTEL
jgi:hypothetical protein